MIPGIKERVEAEVLAMRPFESKFNVQLAGLLSHCVILNVQLYSKFSEKFKFFLNWETFLYPVMSKRKSFLKTIENCVTYVNWYFLQVKISMKQYWKTADKIQLKNKTLYKIFL